MDTYTFWNQTAARNDTQADTVFLLFNCTVLTLTLTLGLPGNLWICWVVSRTKSLQTCNNALLVSLAASDLLKCAVDTPLLLSSFLRSGPGSRVSVPVCALQQFTYALCSCVQLLTLVSISVERFQAIAFPFQTGRRRARVRLWILSIWACGLGLAVISLTLSKKVLLYMLCRPHIGEYGGEEDLRYSDPFGPFVLVPVWGLSLTLIVVHYVRIFMVVRQHRKKLFNRGVQLRTTVSGQVWDWLSVPADPAAGTGPRDSFRSLPPVGSSSPLPPRRTVLLVAEAGTSSTAGGGAPSPEGQPEIVGAVCLLTPGAKERGKKQIEGKVAQRFGYIIIAFTLFWVPMVVIMIMNINSWQDTDRLLRELETSAMVLTCMQAAVDPLIYTFVTRQFRSELSKILSSFPGCPLKLRD
ncbi:5-hydroxytryptamine receptor 1-like [Echeneis naucrates]|uniref:5-hydroxytryptamine receptor 1-like n=1 Tax=Echeneis naucrates TaxID=173247 RepID=UPI0011134E09|nr:5-hydroxytryptamine receptor 1-like [Echeneis naucrates]